MDDYVRSLISEMQSRELLLEDRKFNTIFFGGGTPSLLSYKHLETLFETLYKCFRITESAEITIEANPGTMDRKKLSAFRHLPINRISFGVQSFIDSELKFLTRIHDSAEAVRSIRQALDAGFENINLDLIFAIPGQSPDNWKYNLDKAVSLDTRHISAYSLIFEEGTPLFSLLDNKKVHKTDTDTEREMYDYTMMYLSDCGFAQYEISNYAKPGSECLHNLNYWTHEEYIGFGASAASYVNNFRWVNIRSIDKYIQRILKEQNPYDFIEFIDTDTSIYEFIFLGLRSKGINFKTFRDIYKIDFRDKYSNTIDILTHNGFASANNEYIRLTPKGYAVCDEIIASYF
jgi:oxygen-independent coproporphyrinogen III oxidase